MRKEIESAGYGDLFSGVGGPVGSSGVFGTDEDGVCAWDWLLLERTEERLGDISRLRPFTAVESKRS